MLRDAGGSLWGAVVFSLALVFPGYWLGSWIDLCGFRRRGLREQMAWSVALSFGLTLPLVGLAWLGGMPLAEGTLVGMAVVMVARFVRRMPRLDVSRRGMWIAGAVAGLWVLVVVFSLIDLGVGSRLFMSVTAYDHGLRTAFVDAVMRTGVPPVNPLYWPGHDSPMRYYYFWYVVCGVVGNIAHISARQALVASCVWPLAGVGAMIALFGRYLLGWRGEVLTRRWRVGVLLLAVTGIDLPVVIYNGIASGIYSGDMEWWSIDQVTSWVDTFLWVPHHAAALVCCLLCLLLLWMAAEVETVTRGRLTMAALAGVSFSGAFGLSTYIALANAGIVVCWAVWRLFYMGRGRVLTAVAVAGLVSALVLTPYLVQLMHREAGQAQAAGHVLGPGVREMLDPGMLLPLPWKLATEHPYRAREIAALVLLVPGYAIELGFFGVVLILAQWRRGSRSAGDATLLFWTWAGLGVASFVRSQVIVTNDYGMRASLLPQFFLLMLGVWVLVEASGWVRWALLGLAAVGVCGSVYQVGMLRTNLAWKEAHGDPLTAELAERNYVLRDVYSRVSESVPRAARLQFDNGDGGFFLDSEMLQVGRQVISEERGCNVSFGGEVSACGGINVAMTQLFPRAEQPSVGDRVAAGVCGQIGAEYLVATRWDRVWADRGSWVWTLPAVVERPEARVVRCVNGP